MIKPHRDKAIIDALGGAAKVAHLLKFAPTGGTQRVYNWTTRGIPAAVRWRHMDVFGAPRTTAARAKRIPKTNTT